MSEDTIGSEARHRNTRASEQQKIELVKYFEQNPNALRIVNGSTGDQKCKQRIWIEIAHRLNLMEGGTLKSTSKWAKYWNDIIIYTKCRAKNVISGKSKNDRAPTNVDKKILKITGQEHLLKKWFASLDQGSNNSTNSTVQHEQNSNSDACSLFEEENEQVSSSEHQSIRTKLHDTESEVSLSVGYDRMSEKRNNQIECKLNTGTTSSPHPHKKIKCEVNTDTFHNHQPQNDFHELKDLFKEIPNALITLSNSFLTLSEAINNVASALERRNH